MGVQVEVCVASLEEAGTAISCGVESVELCAWLGCGGITPSMGLVRQAGLLSDAKLRVLVRPGPGDFTYSNIEMTVLLDDLHMLAGVERVHGLVTGVLDTSNGVDEAGLRRLIVAAGSKEFTFHRAIDGCIDPRRSFEHVIGSGAQRILTSGGCSRAIDGVDLLKWMVDRSPVGTTIAAAGGINAENVVELVERTGVPEVHFAAQRSVNVDHALSLSSTSEGRLRAEPDRAKIEAVLEALDKAGLR